MYTHYFYLATKSIHALMLMRYCNSTSAGIKSLVLAKEILDVSLHTYIRTVP